MNTMADYGITINRLGMSGLLFWFGAQQLLHAADWTGYVPPEVVALSGISAHTIVLANGSAELACAALLLLGVFTRVVAFVMAVHLAAIAYSLGNTPVGIRDWGLAAAMVSLVFTGAGAFAFDKDGR
jgi:uncharacterized membrane protein YphA (DoxX/SURF4 family)